MRHRTDRSDRHPWSKFGIGLAGLVLAATFLAVPAPAAAAVASEEKQPARPEKPAPQTAEQQPVKRPADGQEADRRTADARKTAAPDPGTSASRVTKMATAGADAVDSAASDEPLRFTNDDLPRIPRMYRGESGAPDATATAGKIGKKPHDQSSSVSAGATPAPEGSSTSPGETTAQRRKQLQRQIIVLQERINHLKARRLSVQNPLHRGVTRGREDEGKAVGGRSGDAQLEWVDRQLAGAERELRETQAALSAL